MALLITVDDPAAADVRALLERHLAFAQEMTPAGHVHALEVGGLLERAVTFFAARLDGAVVAVGALKELDPSHGELKSMHTAAGLRGRGIGRVMLDHLLGVAAARRYRRVSLETGTMEAFAPARALYESAGFRPSAPYGEHTDNPYSICMTLELHPSATGFGPAGRSGGAGGERRNP